MYLKCDQHNRKVLVTRKQVSHRTGDRSKCNTSFVVIGDREYLFREGTLTQLVGSQKVELVPDYDCAWDVPLTWWAD